VLPLLLVIVTNVIVSVRAAAAALVS
jgi:hypothetical protein